LDTFFDTFVNFSIIPSLVQEMQEKQDFSAISLADEKSVLRTEI